MYVVECGAERPKKVKLVDKATMQIWAQPRTNRRTRFHGIQLRWQPVRTACTCLTIRLCPPIGVFVFSRSSCSSTLWRQDFPKLNPTSKRALLLVARSSLICARREGKARLVVPRTNGKEREGTTRGGRTLDVIFFCMIRR